MTNVGWKNLNAALSCLANFDICDKGYTILETFNDSMQSFITHLQAEDEEWTTTLDGQLKAMGVTCNAPRRSLAELYIFVYNLFHREEGMHVDNARRVWNSIINNESGL